MPLRFDSFSTHSSCSFCGTPNALNTTLIANIRSGWLIKTSKNRAKPLHPAARAVSTSDRSSGQASRDDEEMVSDGTASAWIKAAIRAASPVVYVLGNRKIAVTLESTRATG